MFEYKPDYEQVLGRYEAWWDAQILDRALVSITYPQPLEHQVPWPQKEHAGLRDRWLDTDFAVRSAEARMANAVWAGDALPIAFPNLGPEVFSAFYGCPLEFGETTSWSVPVLRDWSRATLDALRLDRDSFYFRKLVEMTDALIEAGRGRFIVGYTDVHPGGDAVAAFRDPQELCIDMLERPQEVRALVERVTDDFLAFYELFYERLSAAGMPSTSWLPATCHGRYHIPSNDFSCMVSDALFEEVFLPGIARECRHMDRCIYHLDGPQALRFLDPLLDLPEIHAIQWVAGAGHDHWSDWIHVFQHIQQRGKAFCLGVPLSELDRVFEALRPEGTWLQVGGVPDRDTAEAVLRAVARWGR
jgi:hypothetical protein